MFCVQYLTMEIKILFNKICAAQLEICFIQWINSIADLNVEQVIAIDGKTVRGAKDKGKKSPIHMVSAWACENNLVLGQVKPNEKSTRYYISSLEKDAEYFQYAIRSHWGIENKLHWILDVAFSEDSSRKRAGNAAQNYSLLLRIALNLLKNEKTEKQGIKGKRLRAAWDNQYLC